MVFSSLTFIYVFLPIVLGLYYLMPKQGKNIIILAASLVFYAWGEPTYIVVMLFSTLVDYTAGRLMDHYDDKPGLRKLFLIISLVVNLSLLGVFKYSSFVIGSINGAFGLSIPDPQLPLPIGISFYTFQSMSYTIDMYLRNIKVQKNILNFTSFVTLFPQLVAGPIVRYEDIANEIDNREITLNMIAEGVGYFVKGLAKKVLLANNIGMVWTSVKAMQTGELSVVTAWLGILAFTFQIYFDFSGYSDMARGLGKMLGFHFPANFNYPYISRSISEFWRRWHITLGSWFRSYVYIPLGGNRNGMAKTIRNLLIVWFLTGLWHGASWNFILWGLYFGVLIILERLFLGKLLERLPKIISTAYAFILVVFGWVLFDVEGLGGALGYMHAMVGGNGVLVDSTAQYLLSSYLLMFAICIFAATDWFSRLSKLLYTKLPRVLPFAEPACQLVLMLMCTAYLVDATYNPFLYFRF